jgi:hypothetical protein
VSAFFILGSVKAQCCYLTLLIVVEGEKTPPKMLTHFHRACAGSRKPNQCPAGSAGQKNDKLAWKSTGKFNSAK